MGLFGIHGSIAGGLYNAVEEADALGCSALQIFTANQRMWTVKNPTDSDVNSFITARKKSGIKKIVSHSSYLMNLASVNEELLEKSRKTFSDEMDRVERLKIDALVFHPGSFTNGTFEKGIQNIIDSINAALKNSKNFNSMLLLETTAGSGSSIGGKFEHLAHILSKIKQNDKTGICFDTAHTFEAGYNTKDDYEGVFKEFDKIIGVKKIHCFHVNDSKTPFGSHSDRHEHIGLGELGKVFFENLVNDKRFKDVPMILETPPENGMDKKNLAVLTKLVRKK